MYSRKSVMGTHWDQGMFKGVSRNLYYRLPVVS